MDIQTIIVTIIFIGAAIAAVRHIKRVFSKNVKKKDSPDSAEDSCGQDCPGCD